MKFAVTGGAGFIGSYIVKFLLKKGHEVIVIDNLNTGVRENLLEVNDKIEFHVIDIRNKIEIKKVLKNTSGIFHHAALTNVSESFSKQEEYFDVNVNGTRNIFEISKEFGIRVVYASSSSVYGDVNTIPIKENFPLNPLHPYGKTKLECEILAKKFSIEGLQITVLRYFNVFGIGQTESYAGVITKFLNRLRQRKPPIVNGDGKQTRDFVYVNDVVKANYSAMKSDVKFGFFNIGSGKSISIVDLAQMMIDASGLSIKPIFHEPIPGDAKFSQADISLARKELGWIPESSLETWFKEISITS